MCDPITIAGAALTAGGIAANSIGQSQVAAASNRAASAERSRQEQLRQEAAAVQQHSNSLYDGFAGKQQERAGTLTDYLRSEQLPAQAGTATIEAPASSSNITTQGETAQRAKADAYAQQQAGALGDLRSFADMLGTNTRAQARDAGQIGQIGNFMRGSSSVLPMELNAASHAGDTMKTMGGLAEGLGKVGVAAGLGGAFGGASSGAGGAVSLPSFAASPGSLASMYPSAPMSLANAFSKLPTFAGSSNPYRTF